jgi:hypothetical protein
MSNEIINIPTEKTTPDGTEYFEGQNAGGGALSSFRISGSNLKKLIPDADATTKGIARLYTGFGSNTDGAIRQSAFAPYVIDQVSTSVAGGTITLDMNSQIQRSHIGSATFATAKILAMSNTTNSLFFNFIFEITSVSAVLTFPSDWVSSSLDFNGTAWTPPNTGKFEFGGSFDDINNIWYIKISGPFT